MLCQNMQIMIKIIIFIRYISCLFISSEIALFIQSYLSYLHSHECDKISREGLDEI